MIDKVADGRMDRRAFLQRAAAVGLTTPLAKQILALGGVGMAEGVSFYSGGALKLLWWQPILLNPRFATGTKDQEGSRLSMSLSPAGILTATQSYGVGGRDPIGPERRACRRRQVVGQI